MNKKTALTLFFVFSFFYILNYLTPMAFGDDYVYSFIWQGHSEYEPLTDEAVRVSSWNDMFSSQWSHYFTWSGRTVSHTIAQFFLWRGKDLFNIFNAFISLLLIAEIYWCANKGMVTVRFNLKRFCIVFLMLWFFSPGFSPVFFWFSGACNYLWTAALLLGFLLPFIRKYYFSEEKNTQSGYFSFVVFFLGVCAGWTNENSICWVIISLVSFIFYLKLKKHETESWMIAGLAGLVIGYGLLMLAPGNVARLQAEMGRTNNWFNPQHIKRNLEMLLIVFSWQFLLWYFNLRSLLLLTKSSLDNITLAKERFLVIILCIASFCMTGTMLFSPNFPPRSSFPGTVQLVIAACILLRIQQEYKMDLLREQARRLFFIVGSVFFAISTSATFYGFYDYHVQVQNLLINVNNSVKERQNIVIVNALSPVNETIANLSGLHLLFYEMSEDENDWRNVAFARYHGIKGVRMIKRNLEKPDAKKQE